MPDNNLPASVGPVDVPEPLPSEESLVEDISNLLEDPAPDLPEPEPEAEAAPVDDDPYGLAETGAEDVAADTANVDDESEPEIKGGRFAPDTAKVTLDDGTVTTIAELKRGTLFQRDYTKKTQELSKERETFDAERQQVSQYAQSLEKSREYLTWYAEQHLPKQPEPFAGDARTDPQGFLEWQQDVAKWQTHAQAWQKFKADQEAESERKTGETAEQAKKRIAEETELLFKAIPVLKDRVKGKQVWDNIVAGAGQHYDLTPEDVTNLRSHKAIIILRDALAFKRINASAKTVQAQVAKRPVVTSGRRTALNAAQSREKQVRTERLRSDPSFANGVAALMDFDL